MNLKGLPGYLSNLFFPDCCVVCHNGLLAEETGVCLHCLQRLPLTNDFDKPGNALEIRLAGLFPFDRAAAYCVATKEEILSRLIYQLKYHGRQDIGLLLGRLFGKELAGSRFIHPVDFIVPTPLHSARQRARGFNQAEVIARGIAHHTLKPVSTDNLVRVVDNPTQTHLNQWQRRQNVKGIFRLLLPSLYAYRHILLVDDLITTGSTLEACANELLKAPGITLSIAAVGVVL